MEEVTLLGDSITAWNPWKNVINLGVPGDATRDILWRIEEVKTNSKGIVYLMAGVNDILMGISEERSVFNYKKILDELFGSYIKVVVLSILPVAGDKVRNEKIRSLNNKIKRLCSSRGCKYVDIYLNFIDGNEELDYRYTTDGIHLSTKGYEELNRLLDIKK